MGCRLTRFVLGLVLVMGLLPQAKSQITGYEVEVAAVHTGDYGDGYDLNGYVTYDVYVTVTNDDDVLSSIFAVDFGTPGVADDQDIYFDFDCNVFQHEVAGFSVDGNNCAFWPIFPSMEFDSFITINKCSTCDPGGVFQAYTIPTLATISLAFEGDPANGDYFDGGSFWIDDGAWFTVNDTFNGVAGADLRVKIARFTTCGTFTGCFSAQVFIHGVGADDDEQFLCVEGLDPCVVSPLEDDITLIDDINCFGELGTLEAGLGGNGDVTYNLYAVDTDSTFLYSQVNDPLFPDLAEGCYLVNLIDNVGCEDTTEVICFVEPPELILTANLQQDILCANVNIGEICFDVVGGTDPVDCSLDGLVLAPGCWGDLVCGDHTITCIDSEGCTTDTTITITCPELMAEITTSEDISCYLACDGSISSTLSGGTGELAVTFTYNGDPFSTPIVGTPDPELLVGLNDLCPGDYVINAVDFNGCLLATAVTISEPDTLVLAITGTDVLCAGDCTGALLLEILGGTGPYTTECMDQDGIVVDPPNNLCIGDYDCTIVDDNGCTAEASANISEPFPIIYNIVTDSVTCYDGCDGSIFLLNLTGGTGDLTFEMPEGTLVNLPPDSVGYINLCGGLYNLVITDIGGNCVIVENDIEVGEPEELLVQALGTDIDCFGFANGVIEVACIGGMGSVNLIQPDSIPCPAVLDNLDIGSYTILIEDSLGCQVSTEIQISQPDTLTIELTDTTHIVCGGDCTGALEFLIGGGVEQYNVFWNDSLWTAPIDSLCASDAYTLCVIDGNNCETCIPVEILEPDPLEVFVQEEPVTCTGMCDGSSLVLTFGGTGPLTFVYEFEDLDINNLCEGIYPFILSDTVGCSVADTLFISAATITDMEVLIFTSPETCWEEDDGTATAAVSGGFGEITYLWNDPATQTTLTAVGLQSEEQYEVIITDSLGCTLTAFAFIEPTEGCLFIATALTPNGDGSNDTWLIGGLEYFPESTVQVFNRWGQILYESRGYSVPWDGTHNGNKVAVADYYFIIDYKVGEEPITGSVTVKY